MARRSGRHERTESVVAMLAQHGSIRLRDAAARLEVAEMTLRRDGAAADAPFRCLGGLIVPASAVNGPYDLSHERASRVDAKRTAAHAALDVIQPHDRIFLDCGTTTTHLAASLPTDHDLTVVTHSLPVAEIIAIRGGIELEVIGGRLFPETASMHAELPPAGQMRFDIAFLSAGGIARNGRVSCSYPHEVGLKRAVMAATKRSFVLIDKSKLGQIRPAAFARIDAFDGIITEAGLRDRP